MRRTLLSAVESGTLVEMIYMSMDGLISQRIIRVIDMNNDRIKAFCHLRGQYRVFQLSNILSLSIVKKKFKGA